MTSQQQQKPLRILIIGTSIAGPALSALLHLSPNHLHPKPKITLLEKRTPSSFQSQSGQNIDIRGSGLTILQKLGLEQSVRKATTGEKGVQFVDAENRVWGQIAAGEGQGTSEVEILRGDLSALLFERCVEVGGEDLEVLFGETVERLRQEEGDRVMVKFQNSQEEREFDLVVGADGLQSATRKMVFGVEGLKRLGMFGAFFSLPKDEQTDSLWRRWFHAPGRRGIMLRPDVQRGRTTGFMYVVDSQDERLEAVLGQRMEKQKELMAGIFADAGWIEMERILREMKSTRDFYFDMIAQVKMRRWVRGRVGLVGDAGYCPSPISGMGTTLALNGAYHLAGAISRNPNDIPAALAAYEEKMRPLVDRAQKLPPGAPHLINPETAWGIAIMHLIVGFISCTRIVSFLSYSTSWEPKYHPVEEYGFREVPESKV